MNWRKEEREPGTSTSLEASETKDEGDLERKAFMKGEENRAEIRYLPRRARRQKDRQTKKGGKDPDKS